MHFYDNVSHLLLTANVLEWIWRFKWPEKKKESRDGGIVDYLHYLIQ